MNFYKITNEKENHKGLQYETGLNVDPLPWNPMGDCEPGGIYFSREDILAFINYGPWIRKVTIQEGIEVYENPSKPKKWKAHEVILGKRKKISTNVIRDLFKQGADINANDGVAIRWASANNRLKITKLLIKHGADVHAVDDSALRSASRMGYLEIVKLLLKHGANVHSQSNYALRLASKNGHLAVVRLLIEYGANIHTMDNCALRWASASGCLEVVSILIKHGANILAQNNYALRHASENGHTEIVKLLNDCLKKEKNKNEK